MFPLVTYGALVCTVAGYFWRGRGYSLLTSRSYIRLGYKHRISTQGELVSVAGGQGGLGWHEPESTLKIRQGGGDGADGTFILASGMHALTTPSLCGVRGLTL